MKTIYWATTSLVSIAVLLSAFTYIFHKGTIDGIRELGFPDFFRIQLGVLKVLAVVILLAPQVPIQIKEWAYAGFFFLMSGALLTHLAMNDEPITFFGPALLVVLTFISWYFRPTDRKFQIK